MLAIEQAIPMMLRGSLLSYATVREFRIEDGAVEFLVNRAFRNIRESGGQEPRQLYPRALTATVALPRFFDRLELQVPERRLESALDARRAIETVRAAGLGSIYPWCTDIPTP